MIEEEDNGQKSLPGHSTNYIQMQEIFKKELNSIFHSAKRRCMPADTFSSLSFAFCIRLHCNNRRHFASCNSLKKPSVEVIWNEMQTGSGY
ncbi:hypothetical protein BRADI_2g33945v3 [Brachypodium distachyon]|uniref:Uncharacterized protein n=1 Tax=Brachypodium distachyon TaxID=15368 RepID=A0A2K2DBQ1_BRADI|nr:hypothetical protein BRADI_2g33945v3 [Brachypodium distachyon]